MLQPALYARRCCAPRVETAAVNSYKMPAMASRCIPKIGLLASFVLLAACTDKANAPPATAPPGTAPTADAPPANQITALQSVTLKPGTGAALASGQIAVVDYTGWLYEASATDHKGKQFDSSRPRGQAFKFPLGT